MDPLYGNDITERNYVGVSCDCLAHRYGNAADGPTRAPRYPTDLTDARWQLLRPLLPIPAWMQGRGGRPESYCHRVILDAVFYHLDNGGKWRALPADFPHWRQVCKFFERANAQGLIEILADRLRRADRVAGGRQPEPTAAVIDSQSLRAAETVGRDQRGYDAGKHVQGVKRHLAVDTCGNLLQVLRTAADVQDRDGAKLLLRALHERFPTITLVYADSAYGGELIEWAAAGLGITIEIKKRPAAAVGFVVIARRWVVERSLSWISRKRRCVREYERLAATHAAFALLASILTLTRRLA